MENNDEIRLVLSAQKGDNTAFAELVRRYRTAAYAAAYAHLHDHDEAEDATQDALLAAYEEISALKHPGKFGSWLCAIASRKAIRRWTQKKSSTEDAISERLQSEYDVWKALDAGELSRAISGLVAELSQMHREAIVLYYFQGYKIAEIAKFLDVPTGTVKRRLHDAREKLKIVFSEAGFKNLKGD